VNSPKSITLGTPSGTACSSESSESCDEPSARFA
jgi:hypothetical protein